MQGSERAGEIEIMGRRVAWSSVGTGAPLLLINGYAATAADWDPGFVAALAERFQVLRPDARGMGASELGDPAQLSIAALASDLEELLDQLGIDRLPVVGWSMGGFVAQALTARAPRRVEALVLLSTDPGGPGAVAADPSDWARLIDHSGSPREQASRIIALLFPPAVAAAIDRDFGDLVADARASLSEPALLAQEAAIEAWHAEGQPRPGPEAPPALIACGEQDVVIPPENSRLLGELWPGSRVELFAGGGHAFMAQEPGPLAEMIKSFLRG